MRKSTQNEAERQIACADKVILNKIDLCNYEECVAVKDKILSYNAFVRILPAVKGRVNLDELMNLQANNLAVFADEGALDVKEETRACEPLPFRDSLFHKKKKSTSVHDSRTNSIGCQQHGEMTRNSLHGLMRALQRAGQDGKGVVMRIKGIFAVQGIAEKVAFHAVMDCMDEEMIGLWKPDEKKVNKLVVIGRNIDKAYIREAFDEAVVIKSEHGHGHGSRR